MERFFGFDLGDAESAVAVLGKEKTSKPEVLTVCDAKSFITAYARTMDREGILIGENACYAQNTSERHLRFKSRYLVDPGVDKDIKSFAGGVLGELYASGDLIQNEDCSFYVGCPAGWDRAARERYRRIFERTGYPPTKIISESRAALVAACQSRHLQVGYDILSHPVLVVDIGSSTTDLAYIEKGREVELRTAGEVFLGGGLMDETVLEESLKASKDEKKIRRVFSESEPWRTYCEFAARRLKEKYFSDEDYWKDNECREEITIAYDEVIRFTLRMNAEIADRILFGEMKKLFGSSFYKVFVDSLRETRKSIKGNMPDLIFMTGGVSRLACISDWCREVYPEAVIISEIQPEFAIARGLAYCGRIDEEMKDFSREVDNMIDSSIIERIVSERISDLYRGAVDSLTEPILKNAALPVILRWREGEIKRLSDIDAEMQKEIEYYLHTEEARQLLIKPVAEWLKPVSYAIEDYTMPICVRHGIPYRSMSLSSYLSLSDIDIHLDTKNVFNVESLTWLIDTVISLLVGLICGGSEVALIASGLPGIVAGSVLSLAILALGKNRMQAAIMGADIPKPMRKVIPKKYFENHIDDISRDVRENFLSSLEEVKNEEISNRMVEEITGQIEDCLTKMAKVVEIPLG